MYLVVLLLYFYLSFTDGGTQGTAEDTSPFRHSCTPSPLKFQWDKKFSVPPLDLVYPMSFLAEFLYTALDIYVVATTITVS